MEQVFEIWPTAAELARDLGEKEVTVRAWKGRGRIPADRDVALVRLAPKYGKALTFEHLARIRAGETDVSIPDAKCNPDNEKMSVGR